MKKYLFSFLSLFFLAMTGCSVPASAQANKEKTFQRSKIFGTTPGSSQNKAMSAPVEVKLKIDETQPLSADGIKFSIQWINHSGKEITLFNVVNGLSLVFLTKDSYMPIPRLRPLINSVGPWKMEEPPFKIDGVFINNKRQTSEITAMEIITIPANSTYSASLRIAEVIKYDPKLGGSQNPKAVRYNIPADEYSISFSANITSTQSSKIKVSESLEIPDVVIKYGL